VSFQFTKQGLITIKSDAIAEDKLIELALDAGADDVRNEGEVYVVITGPNVMHKVKDALVAAKLPIEASAVSFVSNSPVAVDAKTAEKVLRLVDALEDNEDVQNVSHNADFPDDVTV
jgi:transcriptional/translational regulatory protein YebC/TACO1